MNEPVVGKIESLPIDPSKADVANFASERLQAVKPREDKDLAYWRRQAVQAGERLQIAETQAKDLRAAADEARARFTKYKGRLDAAQARANELQAELIRVSAERDDLRDQVARQDVIAKKVHEFRQSILEGPLWELFGELAICPSAPPTGGEAKR